MIMNTYLRWLAIGVFFFATFGIATEPANAGTFSLSTLKRYETFSDFFNGRRVALDPPDKVYISDYAVEHYAYLFAGVDGETVTNRFIRPDGVFLDSVTVYDGRKGCWKDGKNCRLYGDGTLYTHVFLEGSQKKDLGIWTYELRNNGVVIYTENFSLVSPELSIVSGNNQTAPAGLLVRGKFEVRLLSDELIPLPTRESVEFVITGSPRIGNNDAAAFLTADDAATTGSTGLFAQTDSDGNAYVFLHLGSVEGDYEVTVTAAKAPLDVLVFTATAGEPTDEEADDDKENGEEDCDETSAGNPINLITGNKYQRETDLAPIAPALLEFERHYNSKDPLVADMGWNWRHTYDRSIATATTGNGNSTITTAYVRRPDGKRFSYVENAFTEDWISDPDVYHTLMRDVSGWTYKEDNVSERFDLNGRLISITNIAGRTIELTYSATGLLESVSDDVGSWLQFTRNADEFMETATDQALRTWRYSYDADGNLTGVENPDLTNKQYHYENIDFPHALTGITDERSVRYATYEYNADGLATASYHAGNVGRVDVSYSGDLRSVFNSRNNTSNYQTKVQHGSGRVIQLTGPGCGTCSTPDTDYVYDHYNNLVSTTSKGVTTTFGGYGLRDRPGYKIVAPGTVNERRTDFSYDRRFDGFVTRIVAPSVSDEPYQNQVADYTYDDFGNITRIVENGFTPEEVRATGELPVSVALPPREVTFAYDGPLGQLSLINGYRTDVSDRWALEYYPNDPTEGNNRGRLRRVIDALSHKVRDDIQYTTTGQTLSELRPNGLTINYTYYPDNDRLETITEYGVTNFGGAVGFVVAVPKVTRWTYLPTGEVASIIAGDGSTDAATLFFEYDDARRLIEIRDELGNQRKFVLNTEGGIEAEELYNSAQVLHRVTNTIFDTYDRVLERTTANESITRTYNTDQSLATETNGRGIVASFTYDDVKRLTSTETTIDGVLEAVDFTYYNDTDHTRIVDLLGGHWDFIYETDDFGNLLYTYFSQNRELTTMSHDAAGNVLQKQDGGGQTFIYQYDALNRLLSADAPGTADDITYVYDTCFNGIGLLCSITTASGAIQYTYDDFGDILSSQNVSSSYDRARRRRTITYPSGAIVVHNYDSAGQVRTVNLDSTPLISTVTRAPFGPTTGWLFGNGLVYTATFDSAYRFTEQLTAGVLDRSYDSYDGNGNLLQMTETSGGVPTVNLFGYTEDDRLTSASGLFGSRAYTYWRNGVRTSIDDGTEVLPYFGAELLDRIGTFPENGEFGEFFVAPATSITVDFDYDARGNRIAKLEKDWTCVEITVYDPWGGQEIDTIYDCTSVDSGDWLYTYTSLNRLQSVTLNGVELASYEYNGLGQRTRKTLSDGTVTQYVYDLDGSLLAELDGAGTALKEYIYLDGSPIAMRELSGGLQNIYYIHNDHLGTPKAMTNDVGTVVWRASHDPFGEAIVDEDPDGDTILVTLNIRFPGQYYDLESDLHYNYFRDYDPSTGMYLESDPIGLEGGLNTYVYVGGNPLSAVDSLGLYDVFIGGLRDSSSGIVQGYYDQFVLDHSDRNVDYFEWGQQGDIIDAILAAREKNNCEPINIIGHSYGGTTAANVAKKLAKLNVEVNLLVTIDPASRWWSRSSNAGNVRDWINVLAAPSESNGFSGDTWAFWGGRWGNWPSGKANMHHVTPHHHNEFGKMFTFTPSAGDSPLAGC